MFGYFSHLPGGTNARKERRNKAEPFWANLHFGPGQAGFDGTDVPQ
jgi:hypothetical protein